MSRQPIEPDFDGEFWAAVHHRVDQVRAITREELSQAEHALLAVEAQAEVVPVFPGPFWARVNKRASKVRKMALDELADAEERLVNQPAGARTRSRLAMPAFQPRRRSPSSVPLRARFNTVGFVTAVMAALLLLPQVVPISSLAGVKPGSPLAILFSSEDPKEPSASEPAGGSRGSAVGGPGGGGGAAGGTGSYAGARIEPANPNPSQAASPARSGAPGSTEAAKGGSSGGSGSSGQGAPGTSANASPGSAGSSSEDGASAGSAPNAPSNLLVTAVDDSTVRLRWKDNSQDETGFVIERRGQTAVGRQTTEADTKSYLWTGLAAGSEYCFRVRARNAIGVSDWVPEQYRCVTTHSAQSGPGPVTLTPIPCSNEGGMSAGAEVQETSIQFRNDTSQPVRIYALSRAGVREPTAISLAPQGTTSVSTFLGHPYVVTSADEAAGCLAIFTGEGWSSVAVIREPSA